VIRHHGLESTRRLLAQVQYRFDRFHFEARDRVMLVARCAVETLAALLDPRSVNDRCLQAQV